MQKFIKEAKPDIIEAEQWQYGKPHCCVSQEYDKLIVDGKVVTPAYGVVVFPTNSFTVREGEWVVRWTNEKGEVCMSSMNAEEWAASGYVPYGNPDRAVKSLVIAFTLKGQDFNVQIRPVVQAIKAKHPNADVLVNGFMPRAVVEQKGYDTSVCDCFDSLFPHQLSIYDVKTGPQRHFMARLARELRAKVYIIGDVVDGVKEEAEYYSAYGLIPEYVPTAPVLTEEEKISVAEALGATIGDDGELTYY